MMRDLTLVDSQGNTLSKIERTVSGSELLYDAPRQTAVS
jgi:hypothetical protein